MENYEKLMEENEQLKIELATLKLKIDEETNNLKRHLANIIDEYKRQLTQQNHSNTLELNKTTKKYALVVLNVMDVLEQAVIIAEGHVKTALEMTLKQIDSHLNQLGITPVDNSVFDANNQEIISTISDETKQDNEIIEVKQKGYLFNDFLIRTSQVIINKL
jgi:molecular chaperone GrpE (heat shock protein)